MKNRNLQTIIEDYFSITGRPIATLTVDEYVKFLEISGQASTYSTHNIPTPEYEPLEQFREESEDDFPSAENAPIVTIHKPESASPMANIEKNKPSKEEMLKIMRSVSS